MVDLNNIDPQAGAVTADGQGNTASRMGEVSPSRNLANMLIAEHLITEGQYQEAVGLYRQHGGFIGYILVEQGHVKQTDITSCLVKQCKIPHLSLLDYDISAEALRIIPEELCRRYRLLPIDKLGRILTIAMVDPLDTEALALIRALCPELRIKPILCNWQHFELVSNRVFFKKEQGGDGQVSASSFGLPVLKSQKPVPAVEAVIHTPVDTGDTSPLSADQINALVQASLDYDVQAGASSHDPLTETVEALPGVEPALLINAIREGVSDALQQVLKDNQQAQEHREDRLTQIAEATLQSIQQTSQLMESMTVSSQRQQDLSAAGKKNRASVTAFGRGLDQAHKDKAAQPEDEAVFDSIRSELPLEALTFENFLPGEANVFIFKVSQAVAEHPGEKYNPFFLYGPVGTGKTHLTCAIGNAIQEKSNKRVGYVSASHFSRHLSEAIADNAINMFRENYSCWDVLILDDIQFMGGRIEAQEEFFHIFNVLHQQGRQIIIASDKAPDRLGLLEQRLVSRFSSGIVAELHAPEYQTRMAILRQQAQKAGIAMSDEMLALVAMRVSDDVRKMTGAFHKITAYASLVGKEITGELVNEILSHLGGNAAA